MKKYLSILVFLIFTSNSGSAQQKQSVGIDYIQSNVNVLDEWKKPGLYSPDNLFDGDLGTCYAEGATGRDEIECEFFFDKLIYMDEIRVVNGFAKNDEYFINNNRILSFGVSFSNSKEKRREFAQESFFLKDTKEWQSLKFKKAYYVNSVLISDDVHLVRDSNRCVNGQCISILKGSKYDDTCITELEFYYKGQKIEINNAAKLKNNYINQIQSILNKAFSDKAYGVSFSPPSEPKIVVCVLYSHKNGTFKIDNIEKNKYFSGDIKTYMPGMWKVEDSKLYMRLNGKWLLYKYYLSFDGMMVPNTIYIYTMPFDRLPKGSEFDFFPINIYE